MKFPARLLPYFAILGATAVGASSGLFVKSVPYGSLALVGFRTLVPVLVLMPLLLVRGGLGAVAGPSGSRRMLWSASLLNAFRTLLYVGALKLSAMGNAVVIFYSWPVFALLMNSLSNRQKLRWKQLAVVVGAFGGTVVMNLHRDFAMGRADILGSAMMLAAALLYAVISLMFKHSLVHSSEAEVLFFQNIAGAVLCSPFLIGEFHLGAFNDVLLSILYALAVGLVVFWLFFYALKRLDIGQYGALSYMEVLFAIIYGAAFFGEDVTINMFFGAIMIIASSISAQRMGKNMTKAMPSGPSTPEGSGSAGS